MEVFVDQQSLGIRKYLKAVGITVHNDSEIRGTNDTREGVPDDRVLEFVASHPDWILVTKDRKLGKRAKDTDLKVVWVDESEAVAVEVLRKLALKAY